MSVATTISIIMASIRAISVCESPVFIILTVRGIKAPIIYLFQAAH